MSTRRPLRAGPRRPLWEVPASGAARFSWDYDDGRDRLLALYQKGKDKQWDGARRIDWDLEVDPYDPLGTPDEAMSLYGTRYWDKMTETDRGDLRRHYASWQFSQFLHGEQGAMVCAARIVESVPDLDAKFYSATQTMDEARHAEIYGRFLHEKIGMLYPINDNLQALLGDTLRDSRWDMPYLGMQVLIEGLALAAFGMIRDTTNKPLPKQILAYVMQDEARHVAFGRMALRDYYKQLTDAELREREEFVIEGCYLMRDRLRGVEVLENFGIPRDGGRGAQRAVRVPAAVPQAAVQPHRALRQGHRPVGRAAAARLRRHGRLRDGRLQPRPADGRRTRRSPRSWTPSASRPRRRRGPRRWPTPSPKAFPRTGHRASRRLGQLEARCVR